MTLARMPYTFACTGRATCWRPTSASAVATVRHSSRVASIGTRAARPCRPARRRTTRWDKEISTNPLVDPAHPLYAHVNREGESTVLRAHLVGALTLLALVFARSPQAF